MSIFNVKNDNFFSKMTGAKTARLTTLVPKRPVRVKDYGAKTAGAKTAKMD